MSQRVIKIKYKNGKEDMIDIGNRTSIDQYWLGEYKDYIKNHYYDIVSIEFPNGITVISDNACSEFPSLTSVVLPEGLISIGDSAFFECMNLKHVNSPSTVQSIGDCAFCGTSITSFTINPNTKKIGKEAFGSCDELEEMIFPNTDIEIDTWALFAGCSNLKRVVLPDNVSIIRESCFQNCHSLIDVNFPPNLTVIEDEAFNECHKLGPKVTIPESVTDIGSYAFGQCTNIEEFVVKNPNATIGRGMLYGCYSINTVSINGFMRNIKHIVDFDD